MAQRLKTSASNAGDLGSIPGSGRSPGERNGNPLQYSCLENPMDREPGRLQSMGSQRVGEKEVISNSQKKEHLCIVYNLVFDPPGIFTNTYH